MTNHYNSEAGGVIASLRSKKGRLFHLAADPPGEFRSQDPEENPLYSVVSARDNRILIFLCTNGSTDPVVKHPSQKGPKLLLYIL